MACVVSGDVDAWNPSPRWVTWQGYVIAACWIVGQPILDGVLALPRWLAIVLWVGGLIVAFVAYNLVRYRRAAPYRAIVKAERQKHPGSSIRPIRLDPLTTPVGRQWADSRIIRWGLLAVSDVGVRILTSDGVMLLDRPWSEIEFTTFGIAVHTPSEIEEWWIGGMSESGIWPPSAFRRRTSWISRMEELRPPAASQTDGRGPGLE